MHFIPSQKKLIPHVIFHQLEEISEEKKDKLIIYKLNIDENPETPQKFGVRGIPTLLLFKDGNLIDSKVGSLPKSALLEWINNSSSV